MHGPQRDLRLRKMLERVEGNDDFYGVCDRSNELALGGDSGLLSLWAGQGAPMLREEPAREIVARIVREAEAVIARL